MINILMIFWDGLFSKLFVYYLVLLEINYWDKRAREIIV